MADLRSAQIPQNQTRRWRMLAVAGAGGIAALGQAPVALPWATLAGLVLVFGLVWRAPSARRAGWLGWSAGTGYFAISLFWIVEPFLVDVARHGWMAPFALVGVSAGLALFWGLAFWLAARGTAPGGWTRALALAVMLGVAELARSYVLTGFPWALLGHVWVGWSPMQLASVIGPHGLTLLTLLVPAALVAAWPRWQAVGAVVAGFAAAYGAGAWMLSAAPDAAATDPARPVVRLIQPNAAQHLKWDREMAPVFFQRQIALTADTTERRPDLVIWPETSLPTLLRNAAPALERVAEAAGGAPVVLGIQRLDGARAFNSLIAIDETGLVTQLYDKHHLVPFGEYLPFGDLLARIGLTAFSARSGYGYSAGPGARLLDLGGALGRVLPLICYEAIFPQDLAAAAARPDWVLQITNDAWFGQMTGPYQHLAQARLRAVEQGVALVRAANTGISAVIDPWGRVIAALPLGVSGKLDAAVPAPRPATVYARTGDLPMALLLMLAAAGLFLTARRLSD